MPIHVGGMQKRKKKRGENTMLFSRWTEAVSLGILIGLSRCIPQLGYNSPHLITHYDNIISDVQANKENSWRTVCNVSNWSLFSLALYSPLPFLFLSPLPVAACFCVTDCTHSWDWRPYGTQVYWLLDYTVDGVLLLHSKGPVGGIVLHCIANHVLL